MAKYLVTYDLVGTDETSDDYKRLIKKIKSYSNWGKVQKSVWLIRSTKNAGEVRDDLWLFMDKNDRLFVVKVTSGSAWKNLICKVEWLKSFFRS
jgi:hypothetical protein